MSVLIGIMLLFERYAAAVAAGLGYGCWAWFAASGSILAWRAAALQCAASFLTTLSLQMLIDLAVGRFAVRAPGGASHRWVVLALLPCALMVGIGGIGQWFLGNSSVLMTLAPSALIGSVFSLFYTARKYPYLIKKRSHFMSRTWECQVCGYVYDEALGSPRDKIQKGTKFEDIDGDWHCPDCQVGKEHFVAQDCDNAVFDEELP